jgi:hypothetical protein
MKSKKVSEALDLDSAEKLHFVPGLRLAFAGMTEMEGFVGMTKKLYWRV